MYIFQYFAHPFSDDGRAIKLFMWLPSQRLTDRRASVPSPQHASITHICVCRHWRCTIYCGCHKVSTLSIHIHRDGGLGLWRRNFLAALMAALVIRTPQRLARFAKSAAIQRLQRCGGNTGPILLQVFAQTCAWIRCESAPAKACINLCTPRIQRSECYTCLR